MRRLLTLALVMPAAAAATTSSAQRIDDPAALSVSRVGPVVVQLDGIPTGSLVTMLLRDIWRTPYVIAPDVLADRRPMSVRLIMPRDQVGRRVVAFLRASGFTLRQDSNTVYVGRGRAGTIEAAPSTSSSPPITSSAPATSRYTSALVAAPPASIPAGNPLAPGMSSGETNTETNNGVEQTSELGTSDQALAVYDPAHRDPSYLASVITAVLPQLRLGARADPAADVAAGAVASAQSPDLLVIAGELGDVERASRLIEALDRPRPMVAVRALVLQVQTGNSRGSALSVLASIAGGRVQVGSFRAEPTAPQFLRIATGALSAVLSAVREDNRFHVLATPSLAALSGAVATINAGAQVPTVGTVSIAEGGTPVQSVVYRDSGITLTVRPTVRGELVELDVREERSTFVRTTTGVEDSPTLQRSSASASVVIKNGESVLLAGLTEKSRTDRREGLFGGLLGVRGRERSDSELVIMLTAEIVPSPPVPAGRFLVESAPPDDETAPPAPKAPPGPLSLP